MIFITVAEQKSFRKAADLLGMKPSALSHSLKGLEAQLQVALFFRTTRSVSLTEAGKQFYVRVLPLMQEMDDVIGSVTAMGDMPGGTLRLNGSDAALSLLIDEVLPVFMRQYPAIELDLRVDNTLSDIVGEGYDAGIRLYEDIPQDMVAVRLSKKIRFLTVASVDYLQGAPELSVPQHLFHHRCIRQRLPGGKRYAWEFTKDDEALSLDVPGTLTLNNSRLMVEAACKGQGVVYVPELYARPHIDAGVLVSVLEDWSVSSSGLFLYFPHNRHLSGAMKAFLETVRGSLKVE
ncbi:LysR family transcriptional regulator [Winslowiella iniecta]